MRMETKNFLCTNIPCFYFDTEYFFKSIVKAGFTQIELYLGTPHIFIDSRVIDDFNNIRKQAEKYQIKIAAVHPETMSFRYGLCYLDKTWNASSMKTYEHCMDFAANLGVTRLHTNITLGFLDQNKDRVFHQLCDNLKHLSEYGQKKGVKIAIETESPEFEGFICTLNQIQEVKNEVKNDHLLVNMNFDAMAAADETLDSWMETFGDEMEYIRFSKGEDYLQKKKELENSGFSGNVIFSLVDDDDLDNPFGAYQKLQRLIVEGGADGSD